MARFSVTISTQEFTSDLFPVPLVWLLALTLGS